MGFDQQLAAAEAVELHEYLDSKGIPRTQLCADGQLIDISGRPYYIMPLIDRVLMYKALG